jgi:hypothetical protein
MAGDTKELEVSMASLTIDTTEIDKAIERLRHDSPSRPFKIFFRGYNQPLTADHKWIGSLSSIPIASATKEKYMKMCFDLFSSFDKRFHELVEDHSLSGPVIFLCNVSVDRYDKGGKHYVRVCGYISDQP